MKIILLLLFIINSVGCDEIFQYFDERFKLKIGGDPPTVKEEFAWRALSGEGGEEMKLKCPVFGNGNMFYRWWKDGEEIDELWGWFRISPGSHRTLKIKRLSEETLGRSEFQTYYRRYKCRGTNGFGSEEFNFRVDYTQEESFKYLDIRSVLEPGELGNITVREGFPIRLSCTVKFKDKLTLKWIKLEKDVEEQNLHQLHESSFKVIEEPTDERFAVTDGYQIQDGQYLHRLSILAAQPADAGIYVCVVFLPGANNLNEAFDSQFGSVKVLSNAELSEGKSSISRYRSELLTVLAVLLPISFLLFLVAILLLWKMNKDCCVSVNKRRKEDLKKEQTHQAFV
ncbi:fibroblast growth factor receptor-like 1 isoform X2 [Eurytemora carolleeae]|uniref:fibroblast growth factor receptor-like 1 isoform X2 n=1 Tax=Eurytemora carolleeae TaxID=1294199 RepID=UPI000C75F661|nr:fibroblast growth factor receptor-like 1 isoform X2 [Eurytemora carolleeae]|eukprot:XP_023332429.1 fibroblast growth factor receptor-like 1 isoform X2 [Eurytemora affinis]